jgi:hypothetical protein
MEEEKIEEKVEKFEEQEAKLPEYVVKCELNRDVIQGLADQIEVIEQRVARRRATIHTLRSKIANGDAAG